MGHSSGRTGVRQFSTGRAQDVRRSSDDSVTRAPVRRERKPASLTHPNIARLSTAADGDGYPYLAGSSGVRMTNIAMPQALHERASCAFGGLPSHRPPSFTPPQTFV